MEVDINADNKTLDFTGTKIFNFVVFSISLIKTQNVLADETISMYWPVNAPQRHWDLVQVNNKSKITFSISNQTIDKNNFILWFSNKPGQIPGTSNGEQYRYCDANGRGWIFLDEYISGNAVGKQVRHPVSSIRILLTIDNAAPIDLIADGTYAQCGSKGQPYLFVDDAFKKYHLQIWGYLSKESKYQWYWDVTVSKPDWVTNECLRPVQTVKALKIQEAWWSNFDAINGNKNKRPDKKNGWAMWGTGNLGENGMPDGTGVTMGRTVWHAQGQIPYFMTGKPDGETIGNCIKEMPK